MRALQKKKTMARRKRRNVNKQKWRMSSESEKNKIREEWKNKMVQTATKKAKRKKSMVVVSNG